MPVPPIIEGVSGSHPFRTFIAAYNWLRVSGYPWLRQVGPSVERQSLAWEKRFVPQAEALWTRCGLDRRTIRGVAPWGAFLVFFLLLLTRSWHWIVNPQFYIEDGVEFYGVEFNSLDLAHKLQTLPRIYMGYYHLTPRLLSIVASSLPLRYGPLAMELQALAVQALAGAFFLSSRLERQIPSIGMRLLCGLLVIGYPYSNELFANVAHSQWYLALLGATILCADPGKGRISRFGDYLLILLIAFTGPFSLVLAPLAWAVGWKDPHRRVLAVILTVAAGITAWSIFTHPRLGVHGRPRLSLFYRMLSNQVVIGSTLGLKEVNASEYIAIFNWPEFFYAAFCIGVVSFAIWRGSAWIRGLAAIGIFTVATALYSGSNWNLLGAAGVGERYFFFVGLLFLIGCAMASLAASRATYRWGFRALLLGTAFGVVWNWVYAAPFHDFDYPPQIAAFDQVPPGGHLDVKFPIDRKSTVYSWVVSLSKR